MKDVKDFSSETIKCCRGKTGDTWNESSDWATPSLSDLQWPSDCNQNHCSFDLIFFNKKLLSLFPLEVEMFILKEMIQKYNRARVATEMLKMWCWGLTLPDHGTYTEPQKGSCSPVSLSNTSVKHNSDYKSRPLLYNLSLTRKRKPLSVNGPEIRSGCRAFS